MEGVAPLHRREREEALAQHVHERRAGEAAVDGVAVGRARVEQDFLDGAVQEGLLICGGEVKSECSMHRRVMYVRVHKVRARMCVDLFNRRAYMYMDTDSEPSSGKR